MFCMATNNKMLQNNKALYDSAYDNYPKLTNYILACIHHLRSDWHRSLAGQQSKDLSRRSQAPLCTAPTAKNALVHTAFHSVSIAHLAWDRAVVYVEVKVVM